MEKSRKANILHHEHQTEAAEAREQRESTATRSGNCNAATSGGLFQN